MADSKETIRLLESRRYTAMCEADAKTLEELLADSLVYTHSYGGADSKASYLDGIRSKKWIYQAVERPIEVRQRRAHAFYRLADLRGLEPAVDQLLGRLHADQVLEREHRLAAPPAGRPDETDLRPVAKLALGDVEDLRRAAVGVGRLFHHAPR